MRTVWLERLLQRKILLFGALIIVALFGVVASSWLQRAEVVAQLAQFYPSTCLGGWQQPQLATGMPDAQSGFTKDNSALYTDNATALYCGQFTGSLPPQTYHTRVTVRFSWQQEGGALAGSTVEQFESFPEPMSPTTTEVTTEEQSTSTDTDVPVEAPVGDTLPDPGVPEETPETVPSEVVLPEAEPVIEEEPVTEPSVDSTEPLSWWFSPLVSTAHAQAELLSPVVTVDALDEAPAGATFMIQYTLDGTSWQTIGYVSEITPDIRFEIPREVITTMADVSALQVAVVPLPFIDAVQPVYLDSLWLEIGYAPLEELGVHSLPVEQPRVVPFGEVIGSRTEAGTTTEGVATSSSDNTSTSTGLLLVSEFARRITRLHGIDERYVLVTLELQPGQTELWLFDMVHREIHIIGTKGAMVGSVPPAVKERMIFWIGQDMTTVFAYDLRTAGTFHQMSLVDNLPVQNEYRLQFPFTAWEVVWRGSELYFFSKETGEVFSDGDSAGVADFLAYFSLAVYLSPDQLRTIGGPFVSIPDVPLVITQ